MFGVLVAGQLVQTDGQVVGENQLVFCLPNLTPRNVAVFLTGVRPIEPADMAASIYLVGNGNWAFLGCINNQKPSAMFSIKDLQPGEWKIGIQVEPELIAAQKIADKIVQTDTSNLQAFTEKMCQNLYNYITSFDSGRQGMISINVLERWFVMFQEKLKCDPQFWKR